MLAVFLSADFAFLEQIFARGERPAIACAERVAVSCHVLIVLLMSKMFCYLSCVYGAFLLSCRSWYASGANSDGKTLFDVSFVSLAFHLEKRGGI